MFVRDAGIRAAVALELALEPVYRQLKSFLPGKDPRCHEEVPVLDQLRRLLGPGSTEHHDNTQ